jgi:tRNA(fMet)-specific endonuclease VapC
MLIDNQDILIAGIALENNLVLVTNNEKHFARIPNLIIENWKKYE